MSCTLYVSHVTNSDLSVLEDLFTMVGDVKCFHLEKIPDSGQEPEFGVFEMATEQQAMDCAERFNGYDRTNGYRFSVSLHRPRKKATEVPRGKNVRWKTKNVKT